MRGFVPVVLACAGVLAGCGLIDQSASPAQDSGPFQERAAAVAKAWQDVGMSRAWATGFVPLQELTVEPAWTPNGDLKASYGNGWIRAPSPLPDTTAQGCVRFPDGTSLSVALVGAQTAYSQLPERFGDCPTAGEPPTCQWLTITAARRSTTRIGTSRGPAIVPVWRYTVAGLRQPLLRVAVAPSAMTSIPRVPLPDDVAPAGVVGAMRLLSSRGDSVAFDIGIGACDTDPRGLVWESPELVVIGGSVTASDAGTPCTAALLLHRVQVRTRQPVGTRPIVDALSGSPLVTSPTLAGN